MKVDYRSKHRLDIELLGRKFAVKLFEVPFREGIELHCMLDDEELRVSDRGLGLEEALRQLQSEIETRISQQQS